MPDAGLLDNDEIAALHAKLDQSAPSPDEKGLWIEMTCPDHSLPVTAEDPKDKEIVLNTFCPKGRCEVVQSTDVP